MEDQVREVGHGENNSSLLPRSGHFSVGVSGTFEKENPYCMSKNVKTDFVDKVEFWKVFPLVQVLDKFYSDQLPIDQN